MKLLEVPYGISQLLDDEKRRLASEYITLHQNATTVLETYKRNQSEFKPEEIWYTLLTEEVYYRNCKFINYFCLNLLNRSINEYIVESEVSNMTNIQTN